ncbi:MULTISPECIES: hypothetical protein [Nitrosospira]|uniref:hypothetical protein n=1 Tax=Nitrosospira TaxID=35798 RepID=UPI0015A0B66C|nr:MULTISPECIES: hypothetical protein [Nitrosospira]
MREGGELIEISVLNDVSWDVNQPIQFQGGVMNSIIWWVGFIVIILAILSFLGLR